MPLCPACRSEEDTTSEHQPGEGTCSRCGTELVPVGTSDGLHRSTNDKTIGRRALLKSLPVGAGVVLAGCQNFSSQETEEETFPRTPTRQEFIENAQTRTLPDSKELFTGDENRYASRLSPGNVSVQFQEGTPIADSIKFELFTYGKFPVGNDITLQKLSEKTVPSLGKWKWAEVHKDGSVELHERRYIEPVRLEYDPEEVPHDQPFRARMRATNVRTEESKILMDERLGGYITYGDDLYPVMFGDTNGFDQQESSYKFYPYVSRQFPAPEIAEIPFTWEAKHPDDDKFSHSGTIYAGGEIEVPTEIVEGVSDWASDTYLGRNYSNFTLQTTLQNGEQYDVLDNPLYKQAADIIKKAHYGYGVENHYSMIMTAVSMIRFFDYKPLEDRSIDKVSISLPEVYWTKRFENCVGKSWNLCWLLYHLGYTTSTVHIVNRQSDGYDHQGVAVLVPDEIISRDFPDGVATRIRNYSRNYQDLETPDPYLVDELTPSVPDTDDARWLYIEPTTNQAPLGANAAPVDGPYWLEYGLEPEDPQFDFDVM